MDFAIMANPRICTMFHESVPYIYGLLAGAEEGKIISAKTVRQILDLPLEFFVPRYTLEGTAANPTAVHDAAMFLGVVMQFRCKTYTLAAYADADLESFEITNIVGGLKPLVVALEASRPHSSINFMKECEVLTTEYLSMVQLLVAPTMISWYKHEEKPGTFRDVLDYMFVFGSALFGTLIRGGAKQCRLATDVPTDFWEPIHEMEPIMDRVAELYTEQVTMFVHNCGQA